MKMRTRSIMNIASVIIASSLSAQQTVNLRIQSLPSYHSPKSAVYAAGSFNGWNPQDENFRFRQKDDGTYFLDLQLANGNYEYKITRGGWDKVECKRNGADMPNYTTKLQLYKTELQ